MIKGGEELMELAKLLQQTVPEKKMKASVVNHEKERLSVLEIMSMLKKSRLLNQSPSFTFHSYQYDWIPENKNEKGDHDAGICVPMGDYILVLFIQIKGCDDNTN